MYIIIFRLKLVNQLNMHLRSVRMECILSSNMMERGFSCIKKEMIFSISVEV